MPTNLDAEEHSFTRGLFATVLVGGEETDSLGVSIVKRWKVDQQWQVWSV